MLHIIHVLSHVLLLVSPDILAIPMHEPFLPLANIASSVFPLNNTVTRDLIVFPVAIVSRPIGPQVRAFTFFCSVSIFTKIFRTVWPLFFALTVHLAHAPLASVHCAVFVTVDTIATHHIAGPCPFIDLTVRIGELAIPTGLVAVPDARVRGAICPLHCALPMPHAT